MFSFLTSYDLTWAAWKKYPSKRENGRPLVTDEEGCMSDALFTLIKFILAILLLPVVWACGTVLYGHITEFPGSYGEFFLWGMLGFLLFFLFFYQFWGVYEFGQKITSGLFQFATPLTRVMAYTVPFYLTVILLAFFAVKVFLDINSYDHYFMFFAGFTFTLHILLTAQDLQEQEKALIKPAYLFMMMVAFIGLTCVVVLLFDLAFQKWTFPEFFQSVVSESWDNYYLTCKKMLFVK